MWIGGREYGVCHRCADRTPTGAVREPGQTPSRVAPAEPARAATERLRVETHAPTSTGYREPVAAEHIVVLPARTRGPRALTPDDAKRITNRNLVIFVSGLVLVPVSFAVAALATPDNFRWAFAVLFLWVFLTIGAGAFDELERRHSVAVGPVRLRISTDAIEEESAGRWRELVDMASIRDVRSERTEDRYRVTTDLEDGRSLVVLDDMTEEESREVERLVRRAVASKARATPR